MSSCLSGSVREEASMLDMSERDILGVLAREEETGVGWWNGEMDLKLWGDGCR